MTQNQLDRLAVAFLVTLAIVALGAVFGYVLPHTFHAQHAATAACMPYSKVGVTQSERAIVVCATADGGIEAKEFTP